MILFGGIGTSLSAHFGTFKEFLWLGLRSGLDIEGDFIIVGFFLNGFDARF